VVVKPHSECLKDAGLRKLVHLKSGPNGRENAMVFRCTVINDAIAPFLPAGQGVSSDRSAA
jgi:hypothetical protein